LQGKTCLFCPLGSLLGLGHLLLSSAGDIGHRLVGQLHPAGQLVTLAFSLLRPFGGLAGLGGRPLDGLAVALSTTLEALDGDHHRRQELVDLVAVITPHPGA
jgi:hypothetical protein